MTFKQLKDTPLPELKRIALEDLKATKDQVRKYGHLSYRATWEKAIRLTARSANADIRDGIKQLTISDALPSFSEESDSPEPENVEKSDFSASSKHRITNDSHIAIELGWASPLAEPHICNDIAEIINPANLIKLSATHARFKYWQPWMDIDCRFIILSDSIHTILYFDIWGYCHTLEETTGRSMVLDLAIIANHSFPLDSKKTMPFKTATSNELEVAALKNGLLHQGSKNGVFAALDVANTEAVPINDYLIIEGEQSQIPPEEYPENWELLQPSESEEKQENYTINLTTFRQAQSTAYEVIQSSPEPDLYTFESSPESPSATAPKLPFEDFLKALFLGPQALAPNQLA